MMHKHERWTLERRIPLTLLVMLVLQLAATVVWASQLDARVDGIEKHYLASNGLGEKFTRLEERLEFLKQDLAFMKNQLEQLNQRLLRGR